MIAVMMEKFQNRYRIASARASWWDYGWNGAYFITICTKNREHFFGKIVDGKMQLSSIGVLADVFWHEIKNHAKNIELGAFVVMPNHIHGVLILDKTENEPFINNVIGDNVGNNDNVRNNVETRHALSLQPPIQSPIQPQSPVQQRFQNQGQNTVSSIVGSYKSAVTKHCNRLQLTDNEGVVFGWQSRFHDHIIRNDAEYQRINDYIENNPKNWDNDKFHTGK
ncbi:transposase [Runella sp. CRIBMP]|uniref:transposase n=1 Tax=Runella sp. CRIBMP TaxID=2683261 RepID=UPI001E3AD358|nr:transposase [Runella sp. CRIBMP]